MPGDTRGSKVEWSVEAGCWPGGGRWEGQSLVLGNMFNDSALGFSFKRRTFGYGVVGTHGSYVFP